MSSEEEEESVTEETPEPPKRGRPPQSVDKKPRYRHMAQEISDDKIRIAQMKLDSVRDAEEKKLANKKSRNIMLAEPSAKKVTVVSESALTPASNKRPVKREESPKRQPVGSRRQALYDSWFPSSPRSRNY